MSAAEQLWPEVMDLKTAASYLRVHPVTLREWKRKKEGPPGRKMGGCWRFHKPALDAYLAGSTKIPEWPAPRTDLSPAARKAPSGCASPRQADARYLEALGLPIAPLRPSGHRSSTPNTTESPD
jgi:excisionase family DNA binding protein